ncbi:FKBP-type peptidyl-prolyl cis-trans isomerase [Aquimarina agarilytica]|uniref:FKBP-type peptidyl-prolyl cis-trans isomerase n=1 Tax=Aquimarina agarilytica TaxID=1087449 RepID=UPI0002883FEA|nr:FKBP-type peptidyl-prolyl cis-trans isomerase [Aquimarina agarilytica]
MKILLTLFVLVGLLSCNDSENNSNTIDFTVQNDQEIQAYIKTNNLDAVKTDTGLYYVINELGEGKQPASTSDVKVAYKGYFTDAKVFDENKEGVNFNLSQVIPGWTEGITYFKEGGSGILLIPSSLGYGNSGRPGIPGGAVLVFDINLIKVNQ